MKRVPIALLAIAVAGLACAGNREGQAAATEGFADIGEVAAAPSAVDPTQAQDAVPTPTMYLDIPMLSLEGLKNAEYGLLNEQELLEFRLIDGIYQRGQDPTQPEYAVVTISDMAAFGDLNGDGAQDAAVLLNVGRGGTGIGVYLAAVTNWAGIPRHAASQLIDDRAIMRSLNIVDGRIQVQAVIHGEADAACCPTREVSLTYRLDGSSLVQEP